jgi:hypothetical protein
MLRKMSLIHSRLWLATIMLAISCVFSSAVPANKATRAQIHARLEETLPPYYGDPYSNNTDYWQPVTLNIRFYSDAACTTPIALPINVTYEISFTGYSNSVEFGNQTFSGVYARGRAWKGESETYYDGDVPTWESLSVYNGVVYEKSRRDYELSSIDGGVIIEPAVYATHLPGF